MQVTDGEHTLDWSSGQIASFILLGLVTLAFIIWGIRVGRQKEMQHAEAT